MSGAARRPAKWAVLVTVAMMVVMIVLLLGFSRAQPSPLLRTGTHAWPGYAPLYGARATGAFEETSVRLVEMPTSSESIRGLLSGALEAGCLTLDEALRAQAGGCDLRIVGVMDFSLGGDAVVARQGISELSELRGKRVGVERDGVGAVFLARALRSAGLGPSDITMVDLEAHEHEQALQSRNLDAVVTYEPRVSRLVKGGARVLCDSSTVSGEVIDVLVVKAQTLKENPDGVRALVAGWAAGVEDLRAGRSIPEMAQAMGLSAQELLEGRSGIRLPTREENRALIAGPSRGLARPLKAQADELAALGMLRTKMDPDRLLLDASEEAILPW